jgi:predicted nuclease of predicted toxin-antitoxin system
VKFLVDAQLPDRLARALVAAGHDANHTSGLPDGNRTKDGVLMSLADSEDRVLVTKDGGFRDSHLLRGAPRRVLIVATGNIHNSELPALFDAHLGELIAALEGNDLVELDQWSVSIYEGHSDPAAGER